MGNSGVAHRALEPQPLGWPHPALSLLASLQEALTRDEGAQARAGLAAEDQEAVPQLWGSRRGSVQIVLCCDCF